jgi:hypothetical protein
VPSEDCIREPADDVPPGAVSTPSAYHLDLGSRFGRPLGTAVPSTEQLILAILGIVGLSGILAAVRTSRRLSRHHRFFRFRGTEQVDMILTTSARVPGGFGITYLRAVTAVGNLKGATEIARAVGYGARRRPILVSASAELESPLDGDLVLIGLPGKNAVSHIVVSALAMRYPEVNLRIEESEEDGCRMTLGEFSEEYSVCTQAESHLPTRDLALIVLWVNPLAVRKRRLIWCAGFTAYGTAAAASYLVDDIVNDRLKRLRREHRALPSLWSRRWPCFVMVIEARLVNDQVVHVQERAFAVLEDPGCPPFLTADSPPIRLGPLSGGQRD